MDIEIIGKMLFCQTEEELRTQFQMLLGEIGVISFAYMEVPLNQCLPQKIVSDYPVKWMERYIENGYVERDKTLEICKVATQPFTWEFTRQIISQDSTQKIYWSEAEKFNLKEGVCIPIGNYQKSIGFGYALDVRKDSHLWLNEYSEKIKVLSALFHQQTVRLAESSKVKDLISNISARELECAQWISSGLTATNIATKMKISERTVRFHMSNLKYKLNVSTKEEVITLLAFYRLIDI